MLFWLWKWNKSNKDKSSSFHRATLRRQERHERDHPAPPRPPLALQLPPHQRPKRGDDGLEQRELRHPRCGLWSVWIRQTAARPHLLLVFEEHWASGANLHLAQWSHHDRLVEATSQFARCEFSDRNRRHELEYPAWNWNYARFLSLELATVQPSASTSLATAPEQLVLPLRRWAKMWLPGCREIRGKS